MRTPLSQLNGAQREALELAFFSGLTLQEIGDQLGVSLVTLTARIREGLLAL